MSQPVYTIKSREFASHYFTPGDFHAAMMPLIDGAVAGVTFLGVIDDLFSTGAASFVLRLNGAVVDIFVCFYATIKE